MKNSALHEIVSLDQDLSSGQSELRLDTRSSSAQASMSLFLRHFKGRNDFSRCLTSDCDPSLASSLERIRCAIFDGNAAEAEQYLTGLGPIDDPFAAAEFQIEKIRIALLKRELDGAWRLSDEALAMPELTDLSRMTCHQLRGSISLKQGHHARAILELEKSLALARVYSQASSAFAACGFLVQAYSETGRKDDAHRALSMVQGMVAALDDDEQWLDRLLIQIRSEIHFLRAFGSKKECANALVEAREIARWLGDKTTERRCEEELKEYESAESDGPARFNAFTFFEARGFLLLHVEKKIVRLEKHPVAKEILKALSKGRFSSDDLFKKIWKHEFDPERHSPFLRATLARVRKLLPKGALQTSDGEIFLI